MISWSGALAAVVGISGLRPVGAARVGVTGLERSGVWLDSEKGSERALAPVRYGS